MLAVARRTFMFVYKFLVDGVCPGKFDLALAAEAEILSQQATQVAEVISALQEHKRSVVRDVLLAFPALEHLGLLVRYHSE